MESRDYPDMTEVRFMESRGGPEVTEVRFMESRGGPEVTEVRVLVNLARFGSRNGILTK